jgi:hypothetical protein
VRCNDGTVRSVPAADITVRGGAVSSSSNANHLNGGGGGGSGFGNSGGGGRGYGGGGLPGAVPMSTQRGNGNGNGRGGGGVGGNAMVDPNGLHLEQHRHVYGALKAGKISCYCLYLSGFRIEQQY